jgi:hypothetical protein
MVSMYGCEKVSYPLTGLISIDNYIMIKCKDDSGTDCMIYGTVSSGKVTLQKRFYTSSNTVDYSGTLSGGVI